jgi:tRNA(fMet)-specific endonuclease VapC
MPRYILDTDHLTLFQHGHSSVVRHVALHPAGAVGITIVTIEESLRGYLAVLARAADGSTRIQRYASLSKTMQFFTQFPRVPYDQSAEDWFQRLHPVRIGTRDRKIAAIALAND